MASEIKFGTDGWRAIIGDDFTFANVRVCAQSVARFLKESGMASRGLIVGYDTRFASEDFAAAVAEVIAGNGIKAYLCDRATPTPTVSWAVLDKQAGGAAMITSSHNPWRYNGFKYKPEYAGSASPEVVAKLEAPLEEIQASGAVQRMPLAEAQKQGLIELFDPRPAYMAQLKKLIDLEPLRAAGFTVCVDAMYGSGQGYLPELLAGGRLRVIELHGERNPLFPGIGAPEPIGRNLTGLMELVRREKADVGLAVDGDADRFGLVDENGVYVDQLQVFGLLTYYLLEARGERGPIIKSLTTTRMVMRLGELYNVPVYETRVGFKYLGPKMIETNGLIGGEESGGYAFRGHLPERDGVLAALAMLDFMVRTGKRPSELLADLYRRVGPHYYDRVDIRMPAAEKESVQTRVASAHPTAIAGVRVTAQDDTDGYRFNLENGGWLLLRFSGTEPLLRIYTEVPDKALVRSLLKAGRELAGLPEQEVGQDALS
ncbi:MAG: phosphoglucomutase/phosphomannomutase family protein [Dehalococcoidia bacterium]|jgi:phosphomannomutase